jgi:hypothetical protein
MQNYILDAGMSGGTAAAVQISTGQDPNILPIIVGILAPVIKEALFRLIDKIGTLNKERKAKKTANKVE